MKKIVFKVSTQKSIEIVSLIKSINDISCKISIDMENGLIRVGEVKNTSIDEVIELVDNYFSILCVEIDNIEENHVPIKSEPIKVGPQSQEDLIVDKVKFKDETVEEEINKLMRSAYWAMYRQNIPAERIAAHIRTVMCEMHMNYSGEPLQEFVIGDIVDCDFGYHIPGEINGNHIKGIVCNVSGDRAFIVPCSKEVKEGNRSNAYLTINAEDDVTYYNDMYSNGYAFLDVGRYIRAERITSIIGHVNPEFFKKLLKKLPSAFDFSNEKELLHDKKGKTEGYSQNKTGIEEATLYEELGFAFENIDISKPISEQVKLFMVDIGMELSNDLVVQAFEVSKNLKKINYDNVIYWLKTLNPSLTEMDIKESLQKAFKNWLIKYPHISEKCKRISIISLIQAFIKRFK